MKNIITIIATFFFFATTVMAQREPILPYKNYSKAEILSFAKSGTEKANQFKNLLVTDLKMLLKDSFLFEEKNLGWAFENLYSEEVSLKGGYYTNSGWNPSAGKIEFFKGMKDWEGFCWVFRWGKYEKILIKGNCANILRNISNPPSPATTSNTGKVAPPSPAVFCPSPSNECQIGEWEHGPEIGPCAWKLRKTGMEPKVSCDYVTSWTFYIKYDGSFLYSWTRTYWNGETTTGQMHAQPWFVLEKTYISTSTRNY